MPLSETIEKAADQLKSGNLASEEQVKISVILPVLASLGWDHSDAGQFRAEYSVRNGRVDYALFASAEPRVFLEAKRPGSLDSNGEDQLFLYAYEEGIPILILTDGNQWEFYLNRAGGRRPSDKCFLSLRISDLAESNGGVQDLEHVLRRANVESDSARIHAEELLKARKRREFGRKAIPAAWKELVEASDSIILDFIAEEVEKKCSVKPSKADIRDFLRDLRFTPAKSVRRRDSKKRKRSTPRRGPKIVGFEIGNTKRHSGTAIGTLVELVKHLASEDSEFMERFAGETEGRTRRLVAKNRNYLFDNQGLVEKYSKDLGNGWWLGGNLSANRVRNKIEIARKVAGVGSRLKLIEKEGATN